MTPPVSKLCLQLPSRQIKGHCVSCFLHFLATTFPPESSPNNNTFIHHHWPSSELNVNERAACWTRSGEHEAHLRVRRTIQPMSDTCLKHWACSHSQGSRINSHYWRRSLFTLHFTPLFSCCNVPLVAILYTTDICTGSLLCRKCIAS